MALSRGVLNWGSPYLGTRSKAAENEVLVDWHSVPSYEVADFKDLQGVVRGGLEKPLDLEVKRGCKYQGGLRFGNLGDKEEIDMCWPLTNPRPRIQRRRGSNYLELSAPTMRKSPCDKGAESCTGRCEFIVDGVT